jgi:hypothetical protein
VEERPCVGAVSYSVRLACRDNRGSFPVAVGSTGCPIGGRWWAIRAVVIGGNALSTVGRNRLLSGVSSVSRDRVDAVEALDEGDDLGAFVELLGAEMSVEAVLGAIRVNILEGTKPGCPSMRASYQCASMARRINALSPS